MLMFGLVDEPDLERWQAALIRADWSRRPSYDSVKRTIAETGGRCTATPVAWSHARSVIAASWRPAPPRTKQRKVIWTFSTKVGEDSLYRSAVLRVRTKKRIPPKGLRAIGTLLKGNAPGILFKKGSVRAGFARVFRFQPRRMKPGYYILATLLQAEMNTARNKVFVSRPFRITAPAKPKSARKAKSPRNRR
jgi:hypothetical protein